MVLGVDFAGLMTSIEVKRDSTNITSLTGIRTQLGWTALSKEDQCQCMGDSDKDPLVVNTIIAGWGRLRTHDYTFIYKNFRKQFNVYADDEGKGMSRDDTLALNMSEKSVRTLDNGHLEIAVVSIIPDTKIPKNHSSAITQIESQRRRFKRDPQLFEKILNNIKSLRDNLCIIKVDPNPYELSYQV